MDPRKFLQFSKWVVPGPDIYSAKCSLCAVTISVGNMGVKALESHATSVKHKQFLTIGSKSTDIRSLFQNASRAETNATIATNDAERNSDTELTQQTTTSTQLPTEKAKKTRHQAFDMELRQSTIKAEVYWCCRMVIQHDSFNSCCDLSKAFNDMFDDSDIVSQFSLGRDKAAYLITYGLAPFFKAQLVEDVKKPTHSFFATFFDEAFNGIANKKQNDVHICFFDDTKKKVCYRYLGSSFLRHGDAASISQSLLDVHKDLDFTHKCVQVSMDGPNANWSALKEIEEHKLMKDPLSPKLLELGSCSLHILHGAYKTAQEATDWNVKSLLKAAFKLFEISPARRADFLFANDIVDDESEDEDAFEFPKAFCGHRWLENGPVITRVLELLEKFRNYVSFVNRQPKAKRINSGSFQKVQEAVQSDESLNLCYATLEFSLFVCKSIEPFLSKFQAQRPLAPFLYQEMLDLLRSLLANFVQSSVIESSVNRRALTKIDLDKQENLKSTEKIDIGFGARRRLKKMSPVQILKFRRNCQRFYISLCKKLLERSCLKYPLTEALSCFSPFAILKSVSDSVGQMTKLLEILHENRYVSAQNADAAKRQYAAMVESGDFISACKRFDFKNRLDQFFFENVGCQEESEELWQVIKIVLVVSHGNARVEGGFSVNKECLTPNLKQDTLKAQRIVCDAVKAAGGLSKELISAGLLKSVSMARKRYL